ncbi:MAG: 2-phospho-L-lactate guanylyltransferase [Pseudomonadota bacterium]
MSGRLLVAVPMKDPAAAKTRLADALPDPLRERLAEGLFAHTLRLLLSLPTPPVWEAMDVAVVTGAPRVAAMAEALGARAVDEGAVPELSAALDHAAIWARRQGYAALAVLPADLAAPRPEDLLALLGHRPGPGEVLLCPAADYGTNGLLVAPPDALPFAFGPGSFHRHRAAAEAHGLTPVLMPLESLRHDVDTSADLARLAKAQPTLLAGWTGR